MIPSRRVVADPFDCVPSRSPALQPSEKVWRDNDRAFEEVSSGGVRGKEFFDLSAQCVVASAHRVQIPRPLVQIGLLQRGRKDLDNVKLHSLLRADVGISPAIKRCKRYPA